MFFTWRNVVFSHTSTYEDKYLTSASGRITNFFLSFKFWGCNKVKLRCLKGEFRAQNGRFSEKTWLILRLNMNETRLQFHSYCSKKPLKCPQNEPHKRVLLGKEATVAQLSVAYFWDKRLCFNDLFKIIILSKRVSKGHKKTRKKKNF